MQRKLYVTMCILLSALFSQNAFAQELTVRGQVKVETGEVLPGVSVIIKGTNQGTTTDADGNYRVNVPSNSSILVFSFVGFESLEVPVDDRTSINVSLKGDIKTLEEIVVIGYGEVRKSDLTGSVGSVKSAEINAFPATNALLALSGRAAGVQVMQNHGAPGAPVSVRIRGTNSVQGSNEPLYVVDGFPISGSNPTILNNTDIASIEVLKDASATAIYGSRGANGVVIITTKQGSAGKTQVDYETSYSNQTLRKKLDLMNAKEYALFYNEQAANDNKAPYFTQADIDGFDEGFDWQDLVFQNAPMQTHNLTVSGGNERTRFSVSGSIFDQDGIITRSNYKRYSLRANINSDISKKLSLTYGATLTNIQMGQQTSSGSSRGNSLIAASISAPPTLTPYNEDGTYRVLATAYPFISSVLVNPINWMNELTSDINANRVLANLGLTFKPFEGLAIKISGGIENNDDRSDTYTTRNFINSPGRASVSTSQGRSLLSENTISYIKTMAEKHSFSAVAGFTYQNFTNSSLSGSGVGFLSDLTETGSLGSAASPGIPGTGYSQSVLLSYLGRVNYSFNNKYLLTASFRADGSSKYTDGNKWGYFPSGALAWRISEEEFFRSIAFISDLKARASWGITGSQAIGAYATLNNLVPGRTVFNDALFNTFAPGTRLPGDLKWETTEQTDFGIDASFSNNRYHLTIDYYIKNTRDLLNTVVLPSGFGFTSTIQNIGEVQNKGLEMSLDAKVLDKAFKWHIGGNISFNRSKVVKLYNGEDILGGSVNVAIISDNTTLLREGEPMNLFFGYQRNGYNDAGKEVYKDLDGDGLINQLDKTIIGDPNPDFIYGISSGMLFKGFELTIFLQGTYGNDILNISSISNTIDYGYGLNMPREVLYDHWSTTNTNAKYPVISASNSYNYSDRLIEDGSFMRVRNIQLAYNLPLESLGVNWMRSAQIYASGQNLLTFTKYSWWDPEVNSRGSSNSTSQGVDYYTYPTAKTVTAGVRIGF